MHGINLLLNRYSAFTLHPNDIPTSPIAQCIFDLSLVILGLLTEQPPHKLSHDTLIDRFEHPTASSVRPGTQWHVAHSIPFSHVISHPVFIFDFILQFGPAYYVCCSLCQVESSAPDKQIRVVILLTGSCGILLASCD